MKKKNIEALAVMIFAGILTAGVEDATVTGKVTEIEPVKIAKAIEPTIEKHEVEVVEIPQEDEWDETFCDSLEILALCVEAEAGNQDEMGKRLVADVILNRVDSDRFPDDIEGVISQKYQFTTYWDGSMDAIDEPSQETFEAVKMELQGERLDDEILFFTAGDYNIYCSPAYTHGDHYFGY